MERKPSDLFKAMAMIAYAPYVGREEVERVIHQMENTEDVECEVLGDPATPSGHPLVTGHNPQALPPVTAAPVPIANTRKA